MKIGNSILLKPDIHILDYQSISTFQDFILRLSSTEYKNFLFHTRNYAFSSYLAPQFKAPKKLYTRFNVFYLHCGLLYALLPRSEQRRLNNEMKLFNKHWGMFMYDSNIDWKIFKELQRSWLETQINITQGKWIEQVYEIEPISLEDAQRLNQYIISLKNKISSIKNFHHINWLELHS